MLSDDAGLGKSRQALEAAEGRTLVVAPAMVLDSGTWDDEIAKWRPDLDVATVAYSSTTRRVKTDKGGSAPLPQLRPEYKDHYDTVILDEIHNCKGRNTTWTKAILKLDADRVIQLTGTPIVNWAHELATSLRLLWPEEAGSGQRFGSYWRWVGEWFDTYEMWGARHVGSLKACTSLCKNKKVCEHWLAFHDANLGDRFLQRLRDDVLGDLPPLTMQPIKCPMRPAHAAFYKALKKDFVAWTESGQQVVAWNTAAQVTQLAKACTSMAVVDPTAAPDGKFLQLAEKLREQTHPSLVVGHFRRTVQIAQQVADSLGLYTAVIDGSTSRGVRRATCQQFQAGEIDVLCATIETIAEGLTLTAADTIHRLERSWKPSRNEQTIRRIHRLGQTRPTVVYDYITPATLDERILRVLAKKTDVAMKALRPRDLLALV